MIVVRNLKKSFGDVKAVNGVSFEARNGEITGLLGPEWSRQNYHAAHALLPATAGRGRDSN